MTPRLSLSQLLLLVFFVGVALAWWHDHQRLSFANAQLRSDLHSATWILETRRALLRTNAHEKLAEFRSQCTDIKLLMKRMYATGSEIDTELADGASLRTLDLSSSYNSDSALETFDGDPAITITEVYLYNSDVSEEGIRLLASLSSIQFLGLAGCEEIDDNIVEPLGMFRNLNRVDLSGLSISEGAIRRLQAVHPNCQIIR